MRAHSQVGPGDQIEHSVEGKVAISSCAISGAVATYALRVRELKEGKSTPVPEILKLHTAQVNNVWEKKTKGDRFSKKTSGKCWISAIVFFLCIVSISFCLNAR